MKNVYNNKKIVLAKFFYGLCCIECVLMLVYMVAVVIWHGVSDYFLKTLLLLCISIGIMILSYCIKSDIKKTFTLFSFSSVYLVYNFGEYLFSLSEDVFGKISFAGTVYYPKEYDAMAMGIMLIGMLSYYVAYRIYNSKHHFIVPKKYKIFLLENYDIPTLRYWAKLAMYVGAVATFTKVGLMIIQVQRYGYLSIYIDTSYNIPILNVFDTFFEVGAFAYLVTKPSLKHSKIPLAMYFLYACSTLLYGRRLAFVTGCLVIFWYVIKMDASNIWEKTLLNGRRLILIIGLGFAGLVLLYYYSIFRLYFGGQQTSLDISQIGIGTAVSSMLKQFGFTGKLMPLAIDSMEILISKGRLNALFYPIFNYLKGNVVSRLLGIGALATQSELQLENTYSFGGWLTYLHWPSAYKSGGGVGTNYLAESYICGGILCVIVINLILGYILKRMDLFEINTWLGNYLYLFVYSVIIVLPRISTFDVVPRLVMFFVFTILLLLVSRKRK